MKTWDDWSDFEINKSVEKITDMYCEDCEGKYIPTFDYCNSWADMGQLISENGIDIEWPDFYCDTGTATKVMHGDADIQCDFTEKDKALRAAAIVFLMMNGVKP